MVSKGDKRRKWKTYYCASMLFVIMNFSIGLVHADHTTFCVNLPGVRYKRGLRSLGMEKFPQTKSLWGMFEEPVSAGAVESFKAWDQRSHDEYPEGAQIMLRGYRVKNTRTNQELIGWFRIEVELVKPALKDFHEAIKVLMLQVTDDYGRRQNIGEFTLQSPLSPRCPKNDANGYMIISCGGASNNEPLVSNMIVFARNNPEEDGDIFPEGYEDIMPKFKGRHSLNFYVKIPMQDCNQKKYIMFRARVIFDKNALPDKKADVVKAATLYFRIMGEYNTGGATSLEAWIPGGAGALPSPSTAKNYACDDELSTLNLPWYGWPYAYNYIPNFRNKDLNIKGTNYFDPESWEQIYACQGVFFSGRCALNHYTQLFKHSMRYYFYLDRDSKPLRLLKNQNQAEENFIPICDYNNPLWTLTLQYLHHLNPTKFNNKSSIKFLRTHEYLKTHDYKCSDAYNDDSSCEITTVENNHARSYLPPKLRSRAFQRATNVIQKKADYEIQSRAAVGSDDVNPDNANHSGNGGNKKDMNYGVGFNETGFPKLIWGLRKGHGTCMAIVMLFILPVNLFVTRYFKESFMDRRILFSRVWYQVHIQGTFMMITLLVASLVIAVAARKYLGVSLLSQAKIHRWCGWFTFVLFITLFISGGFRGWEDPLRKVTISIHWFLGLLFYALMVLEFVTAVFIPASGVTPTHLDVAHNWNDPNYALIFQSPSFIHIIVWVIIEIVMHVVMMGNLFVLDVKMAITGGRFYFPVLIPVISGTSRSNAPGHGLRVIALGVYVFLAATSTAVYIIANINKTDFIGLGLGPMSCTHDPTTHHILPALSKKCQYTA